MTTLEYHNHNDFCAPCEEARVHFTLGYSLVALDRIRRETREFHARRPKTEPIRRWSYAARVMLSAGLMGLILHVPAFALTGAELDRLVPVIIAAESSGNPNAVGDGGRSRGLMQIQKATWRSFSKYPWDDAFDPEKNVQVGRRILEAINESYGDRATRARIVYTYNTGRYCFGDLPPWTKRHPNDVYRRVLNGKR